MVSKASSSPFTWYGQLRQPAYEGASTTYRHQQWEAVTSDADTLAESELQLLVSRSRHLVRNDPIAAAARREFVTSLGNITIVWNKPDGTRNDRMQALWEEWAASPCLDGYGDFNSLQAVWNSERFMGEAISRLVIVGESYSSGSKDIPLRVQPIAMEYLDAAYRGQDLTYNPKLAPYSTRYGITFLHDKPMAYHFFPDRYWAGMVDYSKPNSYKRVVIPADDILHLFERTRAGQWRGIPELAPVLLTLYNLHDLADATISKQKAAQAIAWIVEQSAALTAVPIGAPTLRGRTAPSDPDRQIVFKANGGNVQYLNPGESIKFYQSTDVGNNLVPFMQSELKAVASGLGLPYHQLTQDTTSLDFSSIRAVLIALRTRLEYLHHTFTIPQGLTPLCTRFQALARLKFPRLGEAIPTFQLPRKYGVDELNDAKADLLEVQAGFSTLRSKLEERHTSVEEVKADRQLIKELGLEGLLDSASLQPAPSLAKADGSAKASSASAGG